MKIPYSHLVKNIESRPSIDELSKKLFQLGHEHEIENNVFDIEITPNRGDCLSVRGILRDLNLFYKIKIDEDIYKEDIKPFLFKFVNNATDRCPRVSFLKVEINEIPENYKGSLKAFFSDLNINKNNFFTDITNFISYETGQPTHCYEADKIKDGLQLDYSNKNFKFETLLNRTIELDGNNLIFLNKKNELVNLAGIVGGQSSACSKNTQSVIIECANFDPESIISKSLKYRITSEAAHKFERGTDHGCHDYVLRRLLKIIEEHTEINNIELFSRSYVDNKFKEILFDLPKINKILGTKIDENKARNYLEKLGFLIKQSSVQVPTYRNDINTINDISEEIARAIGYDNIEMRNFNIKSIANNKDVNNEELKIKNLLISNGFYEVINDPFVSEKDQFTVVVDNPLDSNRGLLRTNLKNSLIKNLLYNERRQHDSVKLFEFANVYSSTPHSNSKRILGIIGSGRVDKNYQDFSKKINNKYFKSIFSEHLDLNDSQITNISRDTLDSKIKNSISYIEIDINGLSKDLNYPKLIPSNINNKQYIPISDYPCSIRDLSFSISNYAECSSLEKSLISFQDNLIKDIFVFDYFKNDKVKEIKIGFRFIFQSTKSTITDEQVNQIMNKIIKKALVHKTVKIPGLK